MASRPFDEIVRYLHEEQGVRLNRLKPNSRIVHDLGVDGDDAGDLLTHLHDKYGTDFSALSEKWTKYFNCEVVQFSAPWLIGSLAIFMMTGALFAWLNLPDAWFALAIILAIVVLGIIEWVRPKQPLKPITIEDLAQAVKAGRWSTP